MPLTKDRDDSKTIISDNSRALTVTIAIVIHLYFFVSKAKELLKYQLSKIVHIKQIIFI